MDDTGVMTEIYVPYNYVPYTPPAIQRIPDRNDLDYRRDLSESYNALLDQEGEGEDEAP
jgi:hypothetical protein